MEVDVTGAGLDRGTARQDCAGSRPQRADRLLIRPARGDQAGAGSDRETEATSRQVVYEADCVILA